MNDIYAQIAKAYDGMSRTQKKIADCILSKEVNVSFLTVGDLAKEAGVSEASVVRFALFLGFPGYTAFQKVMQEYTRSRMDTRKRLTLSYSAYGDKERGVRQVFENEISNLNATLQELDMEMFFQSSKKLCSAKRIVIVCARSAVGLGLFLQYYLKFSNPEVFLIEDFQNHEDLAGSLTENDVIFAISFLRYSRRTVELVEYLSRRKGTIIALTDSMTSPLIRYADFYLLARTQLSTYLDSFIAAQAVINALLITIGREENKRKSMKHLPQIPKSSMRKQRNISPAESLRT